MAVKTLISSLISTGILKSAIISSFTKLSPLQQIRNPVMFPVYIGAVITTGLYFHIVSGFGEERTIFVFAITLWLWFTIISANFAEAIAEGRGKAQ